MSLNRVPFHIVSIKFHKIRLCQVRSISGFAIILTNTMYVKIQLIIQSILSICQNYKQTSVKGEIPCNDVYSKRKPQKVVCR